MDLSTMDPMLIHRVLITDPSQISTLQQQNDETPNHFDEFLSRNVGKRAFRDHICALVEREHSLTPIQQLLQELHQSIRALVPNRTDLHHTVLDENAIFRATTIEQLGNVTLKAAVALKHLESPARAETTALWIQRQQQTSDVSFWVTSILYLLFKAEICEFEKRAFYFTHVIAPEIYKEGPNLERNAFEKRFGRLGDASTAVLTKKWIESLPRESSLLHSKKERKKLIQMGWIRDILFRSSEQKALALPEVFALDGENIRGIRNATRLAAAGSALALVTCTAANVNAEQAWDEESTEMFQRALRQSPRSMGDVVIGLAKQWNPMLTEAEQESLRHRTLLILQAQDPILQLLDSRIKQVFAELVALPVVAPLELRTGRLQSQGVETSSDPQRQAFLSNAQKEFQKKGLRLYASQLALAARTSVKVVELAWELYGDVLLDPMIIKAATAAATTETETASPESSSSATAAAAATTISEQ